MTQMLVLETANNPGSAASFPLLGAPPGRRSWLTALGSGVRDEYVIAGGDGQFEWGIGYPTADSPNTFTRETVLGGSLGPGVRVNFTGQVDVYSDFIPSRVATRDTNGDLLVYRLSAANTGYVFLESTKARYLGFDGNGYVLPGAPLSIGGGLDIAGDLNQSAGTITAKNAFSVMSAEYGYKQLGDGGVAGDGYFYSPFGSMRANGYDAYIRLAHKPGVEAILQLLVGSPFSFYNGGSATAQGSWVSGSDGRVKARREPIGDALSKLETLTGYTYDRVDLDGRRDIGLIAQDVRAVLPEAVSHGMHPPTVDPDGERFLSLNYDAVTALLVQAVKELRAEVAALRAGTMKA